MREKRKHNNQETIYPIVKEWLATGERKKDLCQRHGIKIHILDYWLGKYRREKGMIPNNSSPFIPIKIKVPSSSVISNQEKIEIHYPDGTQICLPAHLSMAQIRILLPSFAGTHV